MIFAVALLAAPIFTFIAHARRASRVGFADRAIVFLTAPVEHVIVGAVGGLIDAWGHYVWLRGLREQNVDLRRQVLRQQADAARAQELQAENERLRHLIDFVSREGGTRLLPASVVAAGPTPISGSLRISRGRQQGVFEDAPVVTPEGVVGTVKKSYDGYADVQLIVSATSTVPAISQRTRGRSTVRGTAEMNRCRLDYAVRTDDLQDGDLMLTAGGAGFPRGMRIGRLANVQRKAVGLFQEADVLPIVDFSRLDEVLVVAVEPAAAGEAGPQVAPSSLQGGAPGPAPAAALHPPAAAARAPPPPPPPNIVTPPPAAFNPAGGARVVSSPFAARPPPQVAPPRPGPVGAPAVVPAQGALPRPGPLAAPPIAPAPAPRAAAPAPAPRQQGPALPGAPSAGGAP